MKLNQLFSGMLTAVMMISGMPEVTVFAAKSSEVQPYVLFAADKGETQEENEDETFDAKNDMIYLHDKITENCFSDGCYTYSEDYSYSDMNILLTDSIHVTGTLLLEGNFSSDSNIGAVSDITLTGGNFNANNIVVYSKFGDVCISENQVSLNGMIYAPFGTVSIDCGNFNLNGLIIAQNIVINSNIANINYSASWAEFAGVQTEEFRCTR